MHPDLKFTSAGMSARCGSDGRTCLEIMGRSENGAFQVRRLTERTKPPEHGRLRACWFSTQTEHADEAQCLGSRCHPKCLASLGSRLAPPEYEGPADGAARGSTAGQKPGRCPKGPRPRAIRGAERISRPW